MTTLPPVGWADVAKKQDVDNLAAATKGDLENLRLSMKADMERGFRRQTIWFAGIILTQQAAFVYMLERLA